MEPTWQIRTASIDDAHGLAACMASAYAAYQSRLNATRLPPMDVDYASEIRHYPVWVVEDGVQITGGLIMSFANGQASIANVAVDPGSQGQGIGRALMNFAESCARERGFSELQLATHVLLHENIAWYRHLGWEETTRDGVKVFMKKAI